MAGSFLGLLERFDSSGLEPQSPTDPHELDLTLVGVAAYGVVRTAKLICYVTND